MRRVLGSVVVAVVLATLVACGGDDDDDPCAGVDCSGAGQCTELDATHAACECESGYVPHGLDCIPVDADGDADSDSDSDSDGDADGDGDGDADGDGDGDADGDGDGDCDRDGDGFGSLLCGGLDCDDEDPAVYPGTPRNPLLPGWVTETVDRDLGYQMDAVAAPDGTRHVVYYAGGEVRHATDAAGAWSVEVIEHPTGLVYPPPAVALDPDGHVHVVYARIDANDVTPLVHATDAGGAWAIDVVEPDLGAPGHWSDVEVSSTGTVHVAYSMTVAGESELHYANDAAGFWVSTVVDDQGSTGEYPSIAVDADDHAHIAFRGPYERFARLQYATNASGAWQIENVDPNGAHAEPDVQLDEDGHVWIAYVDEYYGYVRVANDASGAWQVEEVWRGGWNRFPSLRLGPGGARYLAWAHFVENDNAQARIAVGDDDGWTTDVVDVEAIFNPEILPDAEGAARVVYGSLTETRAAAPGLLPGGCLAAPADPPPPTDCGALPDADADGHDAEDCGGDDCNDADATVHPGAADDAIGDGWSVEIVDDEGSTGWSPSLLFDTDGDLQVLYADSSCYFSSLHHASGSGGLWDFEVLDPVWGFGCDSDLAMDAAGHLHATALEWGAENLWYATNASGSWQTETIPADLRPARESSLAIDADGAAHVALYGDASLLYLTNVSGSWVETVVDDQINSGGTPSLALDADGYVHIAYQYIAGNSLRYATNRSGDFVVEDVPNATLVREVSMALDADGAAHVSFTSRAAVSTLSYATNAGGGWATATLRTDGPAVYSALALDTDGAVHIVYQRRDGWRTSLHHITNATGAWVSEPVDEDTLVGFDPALAFDGEGRLHVVYYDDEAGALRHAWDQIVDGVDQDCDGQDG